MQRCSNRHSWKLDQLLARALGGKTLDRSRFFQPSMVYRVLKDPFGVWCDYHAPQEERFEEVSRYDQLRMKFGVQFKEEWVKKNYPAALRIEPEYGYEAFVNTIKAMLDGVPVIHEAQLWFLPDEIYGKSDLLIRCDDAPSDLGAYHYRVKVVKRSSSLEKYHMLQAAAYNRVLGAIQGYVPGEMDIVLKDAQEKVAYSRISPELDKLLAKWRDLRDGRMRPEPAGLDATDSPWRRYANKILKDRMDLTLLPEIGPTEREGLIAKLGVNSISDLYSLSLDKMIAARGPKNGESDYYHVQAYKAGGPVIAPGKKVKIPRRKRHLYFDFETSESVHPTVPPHAYLIGFYDAEQHEFHYFQGKGATDEARIFTEFIEYVRDPSEVCLYHWHRFETDVMKGVARRHPELAPALNSLITACIDLKEVVKAGAYMPVPTYSLKSVAPVLGFKWRQEEVDAFESMVLYWEYLEDGDEEKIRKVLKYNEDDCMAMVHIDRWLLSHGFAEEVQS